MSTMNLTLMTDLYELTMMQGYFKNKNRNETVIFDAFYRKNPCDGGGILRAISMKLLSLMHFTGKIPVETALPLRRG